MTIDILEMTTIDEGLDDYSQRPCEGDVQEGGQAQRDGAFVVGANHHAACSARRLISCVTSSR